jgi:hypothetical protein
VGVSQAKSDKPGLVKEKKQQQQLASILATSFYQF